jgi:glutamate synthase domain-containing protein 1
LQRLGDTCGSCCLQVANPIVSALIRVITLKAPISEMDDGGVMPLDSLMQLTDLTFTALTNLRHRGAFSAIALAFGACCARYQKEKMEQRLVDLYEVRSHTNRWPTITFVEKPRNNAGQRVENDQTISRNTIYGNRSAFS